MSKIPWSLIEVGVEPVTQSDRLKLEDALSKFSAEDGGFTVSIDQTSGQILLGGLDELHLDSKLEALRAVCGLSIRVGAPQVAYREKITRKADVDYTYKNQTGGTGQFARVKLVVEPNEPGKGFEFVSKIIGGSVPKEYIRVVEKGLNSVLGAGILAGFPVVDVKVALIDGAFHEVDASALAFETASRAAMREALQKAQSVLIEPVMKVEVTTPGIYSGRVLGDLNSRRGTIQGQELRGHANLIIAMVPLANMFGYVSTLQSMSQGRATYTMQFDHYAPVDAFDDGRPPPAFAAALRA